MEAFFSGSTVTSCNLFEDACQQLLQTLLLAGRAWPSEVHQRATRRRCCIASYMCQLHESPTVPETMSHSSHQGALQKKSTRLGSRKNLLPSMCNVSPLAEKNVPAGLRKPQEAPSLSVCLHESLTAKACLYLFMILFKTRVPYPALTNQMLQALPHARDGSATRKCSETNY